MTDEDFLNRHYCYMPNFPGIAQIAPRNDAYVYFGKYPKTGNIEVIESANGKRLVQAD